MGIGLCLSSGGAKGLVHIGVIKQLEKAGIEIDAISGTSIGALIGGMYAYTKDIKKVEKFALSITKFKWYKTMLLDARPWGNGILAGRGIMKLVEEVIPKHARIGDCKMQLDIIAVDLLTGKEVSFNAYSNLLDAIRASISLPGTFKPVNNRFVDGTCIDPAPVNRLYPGSIRMLVATCKEHGLQIQTKMNIPGIMHTYMMNSTASLIRNSSKNADHTLWPEVDDVDTLDFWKAKQCIREGERIARNVGKIIKL